MSSKPKSRAILQNNCPVLFKNAKVRKQKEAEQLIQIKRDKMDKTATCSGLRFDTGPEKKKKKS